MKIFGRNPIVWLGAIQAALAVLVTLPALGITSEVASWVMVAVSGGFAAAEAIMARPFVIAALAGAVRTVLSALVFFGLPLSEETSGALIAAFSLILGLVLANSVTPTADPDPNFLRTNGIRAVH
jgi:small-conductance mechanosensitive channel